MARHLAEKFISRPPQLEGDVELVVEPIDERHVLLQLAHGQQRAQIVAAPLSVPYPSGLDRLLAAEPDLEGVLVERIPPGLAEAARQRGIAVLDLNGKGRIVAPGFVYVCPPAQREAGAPAPPSDLLSPRSSPFAPKASRVVRILLADPKRPRRLSEIAREAGMNAGNVHRVLSSLHELTLVERHQDDYQVPDPGSLLEAWADASRPPKERFSIPVGEGLVADLVRDVIDPLREYAALSGELAAELLAPHIAARGAIIHVWDSDVYEKAAREWKQPLAPLMRAVVRVDLADAGVGQLGLDRNGMRLVSPAQLYVDMYGSRGREREAAEEMRRQVLAY